MNEIIWDDYIDQDEESGEEFPAANVPQEQWVIEPSAPVNVLEIGEPTDHKHLFTINRGEKIGMQCECGLVSKPQATNRNITTQHGKRIPWGAGIIQDLGGDKYMSGMADGFTEGTSARQALQQSGLNFKATLEEIETVSVMTAEGVGRLAVPDRYAVVGDHGKVLGIVSEKYEILQPDQQAVFTDLLLDTGEAALVGAGVTKEGGFGARTYTVVELTQDFYPPGMPDENVKVHLLTTNSYDGTSKYRISIVPTREICINTMRVQMGEQVLSWSVKHSGDMRQNLVEAREAIQAAAGWGETMVIDAQAMLGINMTTPDGAAIINRMIPVPEPKVEDGEVTNQRTIDRREKQREEARRMWLHSPNLENVRFTGWGLMQGWAEYRQHGRKHRTPAMDRLVRDVHTANGVDTSLARMRELVLQH